MHSNGSDDDSSNSRSQDIPERMKIDIRTGLCTVIEKNMVK